MKRRAIVVSNDFESAAIAYAAMKKVYPYSIILCPEMEGACNLVRCNSARPDMVLLAVERLSTNAKLFIAGCKSASQEVKILVLSGDPGLRYEALACGASTFIQTPADIDEIKREIALTLLCRAPADKRRLCEQAELAANVGCRCAGLLARL